MLGGYVVLLINSLLLLLFDRSTALLYMSNVLFHIVLGTVLVLPVFVFLALHLAKMPFRLNWKATGAGAFTATSLLLYAVTLAISGAGVLILNVLGRVL